MSYNETILDSDAVYYWPCTTTGGDNTLVDLAGTNPLTLSGVNGGDYLTGQKSIVYTLDTSTENVAGLGATGGPVTNHPTTDFSFEFWFDNFVAPGEGNTVTLYEFWDTNGNFEINIYFLESGGNLFLYIVWNGGQRINNWYVGTIGGQVANLRPRMISVSCNNATGDYNAYMNGLPFTGGTQGGTPQLVNPDGFTNLAARTSQTGGVNLQEGVQANYGGSAVYGKALSPVNALEHYQAGSLIYVDIFPTDQDPFDVNQYWTVAIDPVVWDLTNVNIVADYPNTNLNVYNNILGWGEGWEGYITTTGGVFTFLFRRSVNHPDDSVNIFAAASVTTGTTVTAEEGYRLCGFKKYPTEMNPSWENIIDENGCSVGCS
jgi:hypothetical protein